MYQRADDDTPRATLTPFEFSEALAQVRIMLDNDSA